LTRIYKLLRPKEPEQRKRPRVTQAGLKAQGKRWCNAPPYGFRWLRGRLAPDPAEREAMALIVEMREQGLSWSKIALEMLHRRVLDKSPSTIRRMYLAELQLREKSRGERGTSPRSSNCSGTTEEPPL
jgi:hypothetical protein